MRNPALWASSRKRKRAVSLLTKQKEIRDGGRAYTVDTQTEVVGGMAFQPYNRNFSKLTPVGEEVTVHWLGISGPTTPIPMGAFLIDTDNRKYEVVGAYDWVDYWAVALTDLGIVPTLHP